MHSVSITPSFNVVAVPNSTKTCKTFRKLGFVLFQVSYVIHMSLIAYNFGHSKEKFGLVYA